MAIICGADGCRGGWVVVEENSGAGDISCRVVPTIRALVDGKCPPQVIVLDVPIGLPEKGSRACDVEARLLLGPGRASSVFPAQIRPILQSISHAEASAARAAVEGKRISVQAWAIIPKIREVDDLLRADSTIRSRVREIHPEVCFYFMAGRRPMQFSKKKKAGREERRDLLKVEFGDAVDNALANIRPIGCAADDLLDAFAALWTARRIAKGKAVTIPLIPFRDRYGLTMEMVV